LVGSVFVVTAAAQVPTSQERALLQAMLKDAHEAVRMHYFDRSFNGVDWAGRYAESQAALAQVTSLPAGLATIAGMLDGLGDSHTVFYPPGWLREVDYGYDLGAVGDVIMVTAVRESTDAAGKLHPGDVVSSLNGQPVTRQSLPHTRYVLSALTPLAETRLTVRAGAGAERTVDVRSTVTESRAMRFLGGGYRFSDLVRADQEAEFPHRGQAVSLGPVLVWKLSRFISDLGDINRVADQARMHKAVVLDLRGNPGGYIDALKRLTSVLFATEVTIGTMVERRGRSAMTASPRRNRTVDGRLIVLIDSESASSSEILARVVQIEGRGTVIGDVSAGAVRLAQVIPFAYGLDTQTPYAISVTVADVLMKDGSSLERRGVIPDERRLPSSSDIAAGHDPVLAHAVTLAGGVLDAEAAGRLFARKGPRAQ
jgi:C-terminal processing protease CtpA/Prc